MQKGVGDMSDEEERREEQLSTSESIASTLLLALGMLTTARGTYWVFNSDNTSDSKMYVSLATVMPLWAWAIGFVIGGLLLILSSWYLPRRDIKKRFAVTLLIGGGLSSASYFIVAIAGFGSAVNWLTPMQLIIFSMSTLMLAFFGGMMLWQKRNMY